MSYQSEQLLERARDIDLVVFDVDGVLTDGGLYYGAGGEQLKRFDVKDGHGLVLAHVAGLRTAILTGRHSPAVDVRAAELWMSPVIQGCKDKRAGLAKLLADAQTPPTRVAFVGDDLNDLPAMAGVRLAACPSDAVTDVRERSHFVARAAGGFGAVREILEFILRTQGKWATAVMTTATPPPSIAGVWHG